MRIKHALFLGISLALASSLPALAQQGRGGGGQRGSASPTTQMPRGTTLQDRLQDQDRLHDQDKLQDRDRDRLKDRDQVYGSQLMTSAERTSYRKQMRSLKTAQEREAFRQQHHEQMQKRAAERGVSLPDTPPRQGGGMGPGGGMGQGAGAQQRTQQQTEQQQQNQGQDQQIRQQQRTEQQTQPAKENKDGN